MSNQSGIVVIGPDFELGFRTQRWSANVAYMCAWFSLRAALAEPTRNDMGWIPNDVATHLAKNDTIEGIGITNTDKPTVVIDFRTEEVYLLDINDVPMPATILGFDAKQDEIDAIELQYFKKET